MSWVDFNQIEMWNFVGSLFLEELGGFATENSNPIELYNTWCYCKPSIDF